jgi:hypothetical protein
MVGNCRKLDWSIYGGDTNALWIFDLDGCKCFMDMVFIPSQALGITFLVNMLSFHKLIWIHTLGTNLIIKKQ